MQTRRLLLASLLGITGCVKTHLESPSQSGTGGAGPLPSVSATAGHGSLADGSHAGSSSPPAVVQASSAGGAPAPAPACVKMATPSCSDRAGSCSWAIELGRNARCQLPGPYESRPFLARCGSYDAVVSSSSDDFWAVLYDPNTSRPVGAFQQGPLQACAWYDGSDQGSPYGLTCVALDGECPSNQVADASVPVSVDAGTDGSTPLGVDAGTDGSIPLDAMTPADKCAGAMHVALGGSLSGNTCGGVPTTAAFCGGTVAVYVYIDAPDGVAPKINLSPGAEINAFPTCISDHSFECAGWQGTYVPSDARYRLFSITRIDAECGDFTLQTAAP